MSSDIPWSIEPYRSTIFKILYFKSHKHPGRNRVELKQVCVIPQPHPAIVVLKGTGLHLIGTRCKCFPDNDTRDQPALVGRLSHSFGPSLLTACEGDCLGCREGRGVLEKSHLTLSSPAGKSHLSNLGRPPGHLHLAPVVSSAMPGLESITRGIAH